MPDSLKTQDSIPIKAVSDTIKPQVSQDTLISVDETDTIEQKPTTDTLVSVQKDTTPQPVEPKSQTSVKQKVEPIPVSKDSIPAEYRYEPSHHTIYNIPRRKVRPSEEYSFNGQTILNSTQVIDPINRGKNMEGLGVQWFSLTLYAIVILSYIWLQFFNKKYVFEFLKSTFNFQLGSKLYRERNSLVKRILFVLNLIYYISISLFALQAIEYYQIQIHNSRIVSFFTIVAIVLGIVQLKRVILAITGKLFLTESIVHEYNFNSQLVNKTLGLTLIPVTVLITYLELAITNILIVFGAVIIILSIILKFIKGLKIILRYNLYLYNIILYLCTLEILPIFIGIRIFVNISL